MFGVILAQDFSFPDSIVSNLEEQDGFIRERKVKLVYPCKPFYCEDCRGFEHKKCGNVSWAIVAQHPAMRQHDQPRVTYLAPMPAESGGLNGNSNLKMGGWVTVARMKYNFARSRREQQKQHWQVDKVVPTNHFETSIPPNRPTGKTF